MSAYNWAYCPKCKKDFYKNLPSGLTGAHFEERGEGFTLREDWVIGVVEGKFYVLFSAYCAVCGFSFHFKKEEEIRGN